jgi:hypothetical protein
LPLVFFLIGVAAEVVFFFEEQEILAAQEIRSGKACDASADDDDVGFARGVGTIECMAVANLVADFEMFAVHERSAGRWRGCDKSGVDGAA